MCLHYGYRGWLYPYLLRPHPGSRNFSLLPAIGGALVTVTHGYLNARWFAEHGQHLASRRWLRPGAVSRQVSWRFGWFS